MDDAPGYRRPFAETQPPYLHPPYASTVKRSPSQPLVLLPHTLTEMTGPVFGHSSIRPNDDDMTLQHAGEPIGERIIVGGRVIDENGRPVPHALIELWQCNAAGRYTHKGDRHNAPLDPNFTGTGRTMTDAQGNYRFTSIKPGPYPWRNHYNGWRPAHIHFSLFGPAIATRLVTQMYFDGDPMLEQDPIYNSVPDARARRLLVSTLDWTLTRPEFATGYKFDIVLRGPNATPMETKS
jgi:protocatechuate 3,4-dioxygenase beta subunit